jgi:hypothetical protein
LEIAAMPLMLLGTQWYILFNVIAGAMVIPTDLKEAALIYRFSNLQPTSTASLRSRAAREWSLATLVSVCVSLAVVAPFFRLGTASGHDVAFHMASWLDAAGQWKQGVIFPRWTEWANFGFGEPRFIFYPPLSWLFGAFLGTVIPWQAVAVVFIAGVQTLAGLSAYSALRRLVNSSFAALFGAACFAANPYALLIIYMRSDFAELLAIAFFPLLLLGALRLSEVAPSEDSGEFRKVFFFALPFCAIWLSNAPAAVIATYSATLLFTVAAIRRHSLLPFRGGAAGIVLGFGLASFYLIPAIYEQRWVNITDALAGGLTPEQNFLYANTSDAEHDAFNLIVSRLALLLIFWVICGAVAWWRSNSGALDATTGNSGHFFAVMTLAAVAAALMFPIAGVFWRYLPELRFVQFPWRWMSVLALCAAVLTAAAARSWLRWAWILVVPLAIVASAHYLVGNGWWDSEDMPTLQTDIKNGAGFEGTDEYDPIGDDHTDLGQKDPRARLLPSPSDLEAHRETRIEIEQWAAEHRVIRVAARKPGRLALHLLNYPAWRVRLNGNDVRLEHPKGTEQMIVPIPAGESELRVDFTRTPDRSIGGWISIVSLTGSICCFYWQRRAPRTPAG